MKRRVAGAVGVCPFPRGAPRRRPRGGIFSTRGRGRETTIAAREEARRRPRENRIDASPSTTRPRPLSRARVRLRPSLILVRLLRLGEDGVAPVLGLQGARRATQTSGGPLVARGLVVLQRLALGLGRLLLLLLLLLRRLARLLRGIDRCEAGRQSRERREREQAVRRSEQEDRWTEGTSTGRKELPINRSQTKGLRRRGKKEEGGMTRERRESGGLWNAA